MISSKTARIILGIEEDVQLEPEEMADKLNITFYPYIGDVSKNILDFSEELKSALYELGANIVPFKESLERVSISRRLKRIYKILGSNILYILKKVSKKKHTIPYMGISVLKNALKRNRIKSGISIISLGEQTTGNLPMDNTSSFRKSSVITITDRASDIDKKSSFHKHFDTAMKLFAYHMTNIVIAVDEKEWLLYNFNASHPIYRRGKDLKKDILYALIPKIVAPIRPYKFSDFKVIKEQFDPSEEKYKNGVNDLVKSGALLEVTGLYPPGKNIEDLPFRNNFYRWIGKIHLDNRNGMSYGFLASQLPTKTTKLIRLDDATNNIKKYVENGDEYFIENNKLHILINVLGEKYVMNVPDIWLLTQRSGCNKTHMDPSKDLVKMGLKNGKMYLQSPNGVILDDSYKPSFDTKVILAHALGNVIIASISAHIKKNADFVVNMSQKGMALSHWHGYVKPEAIPYGWFVHGVRNPHVACSSPQSAIYALRGKLRVFNIALNEDKEFRGDIHIEPHHGTNMVFPSLIELGEFFSKKSDVATLGNKYFYLYNT